MLSDAAAVDATGELTRRTHRLLSRDPASSAGWMDEAVALGWELKLAAQRAWTVDPPQAEVAATQLLRLSCASPTPVLRALQAWTAGIVALAHGDLEQALAHLDHADTLWRQSDLGLHAAQVAVARLMPLTLLGRFGEALDCGHAAEAELMRCGDIQGAAKVALNLGSLSVHRGRYAQAADHYRRASVRFSRVNDREHSVMADVGLADARSFEGRLDEAARIYDRAEMRSHRHGLPLLAASAEHGRALLALGAGRYRAALSGLVRAQSAYQRFEVDHYLIEVERDLADAYLELNLLPEALAIYGRVVDRLRSQGNAATLPWLQMQHARALAQAGHTAAADEGLQAAAQQFETQGHATGLALCRLALLELRLVHRTHHPLQQTVDTEAAELTQLLPEGMRWRAHLVRAMAWRALGRPDEVLHLLQEAAGPDGAVWVPQARARRWDEIGRALQALGRPADAAHAFESAIDEFEQMQSALPGEEFKLALLADHLHPYESRLAMALEHDSAEEVLAWLDRHRARVLSERLGRGHERLQLSLSMGDEAPAQRARLNWIRRQAQRRAEDGEDDLPALLQDEARRIEDALVEQARRVRLAHEQGTLPPGALGVSHGLNLSALRRQFQGARALVEYGLSDGELFAAVVTGGRVHVVRHMARWPDVLKCLQGLHFQLDTLRAGQARLGSHMAQLQQRSQTWLQALHAAVWAPLMPLLQGVDEAVVVPCGLLQTLPFSALHDGQGWLDERVRITIAPNAALAPSVTPTSSLGRAIVVGEGARLAYIGLEVDAVAAALPEATVLTGSVASVQAVLAAARDVDVLHLACHGEFRADNPRFSSLHLGDGLLSVADVEAQRLNARLVVLSACETARVQAAAGDEGLGLVRAFHLAGARDVVASLWAVDDESTAQFMTSFYRSWQSDRSDVGRALQSARLAVRSRWPHPFHWAAFSLYARTDL